MTMKKILNILLCFFFISKIVFCEEAQRTTIKQIFNNPDLFDKKEVIVEGTVSGLKMKISKAGNAYTTFSLIDQNYNSINVFIWGHEKINRQSIKNGDYVEIKGIFNKVKYVGKYKFYNEIEADDIRRKK